MCYADFWLENDDFSLLSFLDFKLASGNLGDEINENHRYVKELKILAEFFASRSKIGQKISKLQAAYKASALFIL
jgi:hypothetical protein